MTVNARSPPLGEVPLPTHCGLIGLMDLIIV